jgi:uncharacterized protein YbjT (DUF2867 family)
VDFTGSECDAFKRHELKPVVSVSALARGVARKLGLVSASLAMDDLIASTGVSYRALAMPSFMDNILNQIEVIKNQGMFFSPIAGDRKLPTCASRDIATVAAKLLLDDSWSGQGSVPVLGPEDLSFNDMAQIMSEVLDEPVHFQQISGEALKARLTGDGMSEPMVRGMVDMMLAKNEGLNATNPLFDRRNVLAVHLGAGSLNRAVSGLG